MAAFASRADFTVRWQPYQLNPEAPREGASKLDYYNAKFGKERVAQMMPHMESVFRGEGMGPFSAGGLTGNTLDSHRLIAWAGRCHGPAAQNALVEELFKGYFTQEKYLGDRGVLLDAVVAVGLPREAAAAVLDTPPGQGEEAAEVAAALRRSRAAGVTGVPFFTVNGTYQLSGAQPPENFAELFEEVLARGR